MGTANRRTTDLWSVWPGRVWWYAVCACPAGVWSRLPADDHAL